MIENLPKTLTIKTAAENFDLSEYCIRKLIQQKKVRAFRIGSGKWHVETQSIINFIRNSNLDEGTSDTREKIRIKPINF